MADLSEFVVTGGDDDVASWVLLEHPCGWHEVLHGHDQPLTVLNEAAEAHLIEGCRQPRKRKR